MHTSCIAKRMKSFGFLLLPALTGLLAGVAHGVIAHHADLPIGLAEQVQHVVAGKNTAWQ